MKSPSVIHRYFTYLEHHLGELQKTIVQADPCVLVKRCNNSHEGPFVIQVNESLGFGSPDFLASEQHESKRFKSKNRKILNKQRSITFNELSITKNEGIIINQRQKIKRLSKHRRRSNLRANVHSPNK